jgi:peptidoglycan/xylan/chitin deacetylase (PgdA/CDA1 family)
VPRTVRQKLLFAGILMAAAGMGVALVISVTSERFSSGHSEGTQSPDPTTDKVALTFDDGPDPTNTQTILDILKSNDIKATFFVIGRRVHKYPELARMEYTEGHKVGNHTYTHPYLTQLSDSQVEQELTDTNAAIVADGAPKPDLFRVPHGDTNATVEGIGTSLGLTQVPWTYDPRDWANPSASMICDRVVSNITPGSIVLLHDGYTTNTDDALPCIIDSLTARGYAFGQVYSSSGSNSGSVEVR